MTLLGLVQHMAEIERNWFQRVFAGEDVPWVHGSGGEDGFTLVPDLGIEEALAVAGGGRQGPGTDRHRVAGGCGHAVGGERRDDGRPTRLVALDPHPPGRGIRPPQRPRGLSERTNRRRHGRVSFGWGSEGGVRVPAEALSRAEPRACLLFLALVPLAA